MSNITWVGVAALLVSTAAVGEIPRPEDWKRADAETVRLAPEKIEALPLPIRQELTRLGCTIPQVWPANRPAANFVTGRFFSPSQTNIAVLCSRNRISSILVFAQQSPMESTKPIAELAEAPDEHFLQVIDGKGQIGFSRSLGVASPQFIQEHYAAYGGPEPPPLDHHGLDDAFAEKASVVWYWHEGRWLKLTGSD